MSEVPRHKLHKLFATPLIVDELEDWEALNGPLEALIAERQKFDEGVNGSNIGGWQSAHDLLNWTGPHGKRLAEHAAALATANTDHARGELALAWSIDAWANVGAEGAANRAHVHGGAFWSVVYYVRVGEGRGGELVLHDPRLPGLLMHAPELRFKHAGSEVSATVRPRAGLMVMFPAWMSHSVEPWEGSCPRISVAMNIRAAVAGGPSRRPSATPDVKLSLNPNPKGK